MAGRGRPARAPFGVALLAGFLAGGTACATRHSVEPGVVDVPAVSVLIQEEGPWQEVPVEDGDALVRVPVLAPPPAVSASPPAPAQRPDAPPVLPVPTRRVARPPQPLGVPTGRSVEQIARERHLDHPTLIRASKLTFYCPRTYAREARLSGAQMEEPRPGRRIATGNARLVCRELTLEGEQVILRVQPPGKLDVRVTARGNVNFVTEQRGRALRHEGLRILILKNDELTPLR